VSFAALLTGKVTQRQAASYALTQLASGTLAALLVRGLVGSAMPAALGSDWQILVGELIFTLALAYVVLNVTSTEATKGNSFYGLAIGFTVATEIFADGKTTGGVLNLAVALRGGATGALTWSHSWIYILTSILGGAAATALFVHLCAPHAEGD
jgi:aquaporin Z